MLITRESFFALKPEVREVKVPALGGSVYVKQMTAGERDRFEAEHIRSGEADFRARIAATTACDADGVLIFGPGDVASLTNLPAFVLDDVAKAAIDLNRISSDDVEELVKKLRSAGVRRFLFRLAVVLGKTVGELERTMTSAELSEWMAYARVEPLPDPYFGAAQISAVVANVMGGGQRSYTVEDFYPKTTQPEALSAEDSVKALAAAMQTTFMVQDQTR